MPLSAQLRPPLAGAIAEDTEILAVWQRHCGLRRLQRETGRQHRQAGRDLRALRADLARLLAVKQAELACAGRNGGFNAWLRSRQIPRATAYRLLAGPRQKPAPAAALNCPIPAGETLPPAVALRGQILSIHFTSHQACMFRYYWKELVQIGGRSFSLPHDIMDLLENRLMPTPFYSMAHEFAIRNMDRFTPEICASFSDLVVPSGEFGARRYPLPAPP